MLKMKRLKFEGQLFNKSDLSEETLEWLEWYNSIPPEKNNLLSIQFQPSYILMTVLERLTQTKEKNNFWFDTYKGTAEIEDGKEEKSASFENLEKEVASKSYPKEERKNTQQPPV